MNPRSKITAGAMLALGVIAVALMSADPAAAHKKKHGDHGNKPPVVHPKPHPMPPGPVAEPPKPKPPAPPKPVNVRDHRTPRPAAAVRDHRRATIAKRWAGVAAAVKKKPVVNWAGAAAAVKKKTAP